MNNSAKTLLLSGIVFLSIFTSCSEDEEPSDFFKYQGATYGVIDGLYVDFGFLVDLYPTHFNHDLYLTDGTAATFNSGRSFGNSNYIFYVELFSVDSISFTNGQFEYIPTESINETAIEGKNWFNLVLLNSGEGRYEPLEEGIASGSVSVLQKDSEAFEVDVELNLDNGEKLLMMYDGNLQRSIYYQKAL